MRVLADIFTALRLVVAAYIVYAGLQYGRDAFGAVAAATLIGWTLDTVDGHLARAAPDPEPSWLGHHERYIDTVMVLAGFVYLALIGVVPAWAFVTYLLVTGLILLRFRSIALLTALEGPLAILTPLAAFFLEPLWGWLFVTWGVVALLLDWRRLLVRLRLLWDDPQRLGRSLGRKASRRPRSDRGENGA